MELSWQALTLYNVGQLLTFVECKTGLTLAIDGQINIISRVLSVHVYTTNVFSIKGSGFDWLCNKKHNFSC